MHLQSSPLNIVSLSDMLEGSYRSWDLYTTGQLVDGLQQKKKKKKEKKKENRFSVNRNGIMSSFLSLYSLTHQMTSNVCFEVEKEQIWITVYIYM